MYPVTTCTHYKMECDASARPSRQQNRMKWEWRRRNADTGGEQKERQAANATAKASKRDHWGGKNAKHG